MLRAARHSLPCPDRHPPARGLQFCALAVTMLLLAGCIRPLQPPTVTAPESSAAPQPRPAATAPIEAAAAPDQVAEYFASLEAQRLSKGLLRRDRAPRDLPVSTHLVEEAFVRVALYEEYVLTGTRVIERETPSSLRRWQAPVRMQMTFGDSVPASTRGSDAAFVTRYAARLSGLTGHPVSRVDRGGNFHVLVLNEAERRNSGPQLQQLIPGLDSVTLDLVRDLPLTVSCLVLAFSRSGTDTYTDALAIIRAELPDLSRRACYYEELAQGMGLPNDSPRARPSLFNDSAEFAVLTVLDEQLLRILYDPRLRPGMREAEARPVIRSIINELMAGES
ncbi:DUF2927 domain-containing protein [Natronohydrobacter thiooxidans]|uniref:DUF2927 domain-containing protein n=1 Tax=Natronohydrobacter thiooxidans TaxID=87172 RepID=UPI000B1890C3|nr:DUF2927 domain-containing protein [Natronohydrobacter thiooxidans]